MMPDSLGYYTVAVTKVVQIGNSIGVVVNKQFFEATPFSIGDQVDVYAQLDGHARMKVGTGKSLLRIGLSSIAVTFDHSNFTIKDRKVVVYLKEYSE